MKHRFIYSAIIIMIVVVNSSSQSNDSDIEKKLSSLFLNIDTSIKPEKIENDYRVPIDYDSKENEPEKNAIKFTNHPTVLNIYAGNLNVTYLFDKKYFDEFGLYKIKMNLYFKSKIDCATEYNKIVSSFENFGTTKIVTTVKSEFNLLQTNSIETLYLIDENQEFPRLEIRNFYIEQEDENYITITFIKSWNDIRTDGIKFFGN